MPANNAVNGTGTASAASFVVVPLVAHALAALVAAGHALAVAVPNNQARPCLAAHAGAAVGASRAFLVALRAETPN